nr:nucleotidyltransferase family protein [Weissella diestrammenae]
MATCRNSNLKWGRFSYRIAVCFCCSTWPYLCQGAVNILANVGVDVIVCGAEHAEWDFIALAKIAQQATHDNDVFHDYQNTYASTYSAILKAETGLVVDHPNDLLALSYAMAIVTLGLVNDIRIQPIQRRTAAYHETQLGSDAIASATAIRQALTNGETKQVQVHVPTATKKMIAAGLQIAAPESQLWSLLKYKVVTTPIDELERLYQLNNGLAYRLKMQVEHAMVDPTMTWTTFLKQFKSKRYTLSRIQRSLLYTLLNITTDEMLYAENHLYIRVLGSNQTGRRHLKQQRDTIELPMIHHVDQKKLQTILKLDYRAGHLYEWLTTTDKQALRQDTGRIPFML